MGEGIVRESGMDMDTLLFNMENQQGPAGQHRELCSILCNNLMVTRGEERGKGQSGSLGWTWTHCRI